MQEDGVEDDDVEDDEVENDDAEDAGVEEDEDEDDNVEDEVTDDKVKVDDVDDDDGDDDDDDDGDVDVEGDNVEEVDEKDDNVDVAEDEVDVEDVEDDEVKGKEDDDVEEEGEGDVEDDDVQEEGRSQNQDPHFSASLRSPNALGHFTRATLRDPHFLGACATLGHFTGVMREFAGKMPGPAVGDHTLREPAQSKPTSTLHKLRSTSCENLQVKCCRPRPGTTLGTRLCASLRRRNALGRCTRSTSENLHADQDRGPHFVRAFAVEMHLDMSQANLFMRAQTATQILLEPVDMHLDISEEPLYAQNCSKHAGSPRPGTLLCASLHSRNSLGHCTRAILCGNLQLKCRRNASLRSRNALGHSQEPLYLQGNCRGRE